MVNYRLSQNAEKEESKISAKALVQRHRDTGYRESKSQIVWRVLLTKVLKGRVVLRLDIPMVQVEVADL